MKIRIYEYPMLTGAEHLHSANPVERGYLEMDEFDEDKCFYLCNWCLWTKTKPECLHSDVTTCQHGIVFMNPETDIHCLALSDGWLYGKIEHIQNYVNAHLDNAAWLNDETNPYKSETTNAFAPMHVSAAVPTSDCGVALVPVNNFAELDKIKQSGVTKEQLATAETLRTIKPQRLYRHFKIKLYFVLDIAEHTETGERYVVYKAMYGDYKTYVRPYDMFASEVDHVKYPDVKQKYRFELVEDGAINE